MEPSDKPASDPIEDLKAAQRARASTYDEMRARALSRAPTNDWIRRIGLAALVLFGLFAGLREYRFDLACEQYLKRAADSTSPEAAVESLDRAIAYLEANGLTHGNTALLWDSPEGDLAFWHRNLRATRDEVRALTPATPALERSNVLMRMREVLTDQGQHGPKVTTPPLVAYYPHIHAIFLGWPLLVLLIFGIWYLRTTDRL